MRHATTQHSNLKRCDNPLSYARPQDPINEDMLNNLIGALEVGRERNDTKAAALGRARARQTIAVFIVGITIMIVII